MRKFLFVLTAVLHMHSCNVLEEDLVAKVEMGVHGGFEYYLRNHVPILGVSVSMEMPMHKRTFFLIKAAINVGQTRSFILPSVYHNTIFFLADPAGTFPSRVLDGKSNVKSSRANLLFCLMYKVQTKNFEWGYVKSSIGIVVNGDFVNLDGIKNNYFSPKSFQHFDVLFEIRKVHSKSFVVGVNKYLCFMDNKTDLLLEFHLFLGVSVVGKSTFTFTMSEHTVGDLVAIVSESFALKIAQKMQPLYSYGLKFAVNVSRLANISLFSAFANTFVKERIAITPFIPESHSIVYPISYFLNLKQSLLNAQCITFGVMLSYMNL